MNSSSGTGSSQEAGGSDSARGDGLSELRTLLVGPEQVQLEQQRQRLEDPQVRTADVGQILAEAVVLRSGRDDGLTQALAPTVEQALRISVRKDPQPLVDVIFPIIGPAIRKAVAAAVESANQAFNEALEHSLSPQGIRWRIEALRTGKSFAEVVLLHTLRYRVEQVFLIHHETGLLLQHVVAPFVPTQDGSMVSAMLTAIQDFVHDSFGGRKGDTLEALQIGDLTVWAEQGPSAVLAAVIRGTAPVQLRSQLQEALEDIHRDQREALESFTGDTHLFELSRPALEACLQSQYQRPSAPRRPYAGIVLGLLAAALGLWIFFSVRESRRWSQYVSGLSAQPGIIVARTGAQDGKRFISGFRDPAAADPDAALRESGIDPQKVLGHWELFQSSDPRLLLPKARNILRPPQTVTLRVEGGVLHAAGTAPQEWIQRSRNLATSIAGVTKFDETGLIPTEIGELQSLRKELESQYIRYSVGTAQFPDGQSETLNRCAALMRRLLQTAESAGRSAHIELIGRTDTSGSEEVNRALSEARAEGVRALLAQAGVPAEVMVARGAGSSEPLREERSEADRELNRSVSFRVTLSDSPERKPARP